MKQRRYRDYYEENEEMYVYDQSCENCRYYCGWGEEGQRGCIRKSQHGRHSGR